MTSWSEPDPAPSAAVAGALRGVVSTVAIAQGLASSGRTVDLAGLDAAAGMLCARILDLPPVEGAALRPALVELEARLVALGTAISTQSR